MKSRPFVITGGIEFRPPPQKLIVVGEPSEQMLASLKSLGYEVEIWTQAQVDEHIKRNVNYYWIDEMSADSQRQSITVSLSSLGKWEYPRLKPLDHKKGKGPRGKWNKLH